MDKLFKNYVYGIIYSLFDNVHIGGYHPDCTENEDGPRMFDDIISPFRKKCDESYGNDDVYDELNEDYIKIKETINSYFRSMPYDGIGKLIDDMDEITTHGTIYFDDNRENTLLEHTYDMLFGITRGFGLRLTNMNRTLLLIAGFMHDTGKLIADGHDHDLASLKIIRKTFRDEELDEIKISNFVCDLVNYKNLFYDRKKDPGDMIKESICLIKLLSAKYGMSEMEYFKYLVSMFIADTTTMRYLEKRHASFIKNFYISLDDTKFEVAVKKLIREFNRHRFIERY